MMWVFLGLLLIGSAAAQVPLPGRCPKMDTMENFDTEKYLGKWYEAERYFASFEFGGRCVTATYSANDNGTVSVVNRQISSLTGVSSSISGYAMQKSPTKSKLTVVFPSMPVQVEAPYWIIDTDYTSYAVVWSCTDYYRIFSLRNAWILTREQHPPADVLEKAYQVIGKNKIKRAFFMKTDQKNCGNETETNQVADETNQVSDETNQVADETNQVSDETNQVADETNQVADETNQVS